MSPAPNPRPFDFEALRRRRDELNVQIHLGMAEVKDEWQHVETKWSRLVGELERLREAASEPAEDLRNATNALAHDVAESYERIAQALKRPA